MTTWRVEGPGATGEVRADPLAGGGVRLAWPGGTLDLEAPDASATGGVWPCLVAGRRRLVGFGRLADGRYQVVLDGVSRIFRLTDAAAAATRLTGGGAGDGAVRAPIPGMVVRIHVRAGATVAAGDPLATLYAMKLENELRAPEAGVVVQVLAVEGKAVEKGDVLLRLEATP